MVGTTVCVGGGDGTSTSIPSAKRTMTSPLFKHTNFRGSGFGFHGDLEAQKNAKQLSTHSHLAKPK